MPACLAAFGVILGSPRSLVSTKNKNEWKSMRVNN